MERWYVIASLLVQAGANFETENRFGETPGTIMDTGNAGKRVNIFNRQNVPNMAELEKMEAEQKEQQASARSALIRQNGSSGGQLSITAVVDNTANNLDKREGRIEENRS
ncbi:hypothetical protein EB796_004721 [Bugula neritina]|uniref:Uncharacterized protein n=1 Tax=Bugula neritina TaxID=10212 RepID=A0A7J7KF96_BUGNE|nr:hypothetical protein EB796_004721 [Bugula neritina]